jgi:DNA polymerase II small subunit
MQKTVNKLLKEGLLLSPEMLEKSTIEVEEILKKAQTNKPLVCDKNFFQIDTNEELKQIDWKKYDKLKVITEKTTPKKQRPKLFTKQSYPEEITQQSTVKLLESHDEENKKITINDFVALYNDRYLTLQSLLRNRQEMQRVTSIGKIKTTKEKEQVSFIAIIMDINITKNNNILLTLEDRTGILRAIVTKTNKNAYSIAKNLTQDEIIGLQGTKGDRIVFVNTIIVPDVPFNKDFKKSPNDEAAVFISDIHLGSKAFLKKNFEKFITWIKGEMRNETQKAMVKKIKYLFVLGDLVEGIGIYPEQEKDLKIKDIYEQYKLFSKYIKEIPPHIKIIICPGNHDSLRVAEPQPPLSKELVPELLELDNVFFVSSPSTVRISSTKNFSGFDVLIYHGYSFPYYATNIDSIRLSGGLENTENIMTYLFKKRHLAPTHGSTQLQLGYNKDLLLIKAIPDFFVSGHIHRASIKNYRNITLLNCSCWISQTDYQEKRGIIPQPSRAIYVDLKTRKTKILNFSEKQENGSYKDKILF